MKLFSGPIKELNERAHTLNLTMKEQFVCSLEATHYLDPGSTKEDVEELENILRGETLWLTAENFRADGKIDEKSLPRSVKKDTAVMACVRGLEMFPSFVKKVQAFTLYTHVYAHTHSPTRYGHTHTKTYTHRRPGLRSVPLPSPRKTRTNK